jgi:hypothetical protein
VAYEKKTLKKGKLNGGIPIDVRTPVSANTLLSEGLVHNHEPENCQQIHGG